MRKSSVRLTHNANLLFMYTYIAVELNDTTNYYYEFPEFYSLSTAACRGVVVYYITFIEYFIMLNKRSDRVLNSNRRVLKHSKCAAGKRKKKKTPRSSGRRLASQSFFFFSIATFFCQLNSSQQACRLLAAAAFPVHPPVWCSNWAVHS